MLGTQSAHGSMLNIKGITGVFRFYLFLIHLPPVSVSPHCNMEMAAICHAWAKRVKGVYLGTKWAKNSCISIPPGLGSLLEKSFLRPF